MVCMRANWGSSGNIVIKWNLWFEALRLGIWEKPEQGSCPDRRKEFDTLDGIYL